LSVKKIGVFGGTFDPVHLGHLRAAEEFAEGMELSRVHMLVSASPPHREAPPRASALDRFEMLRTAVDGNTRLEASDLEIRRSGPSYTLDTLKEIRELEGDVEIYLALGADAYAEIETWHRPREVLDLAHVVVLTRPGFEVDLLGPLPGEIRDGCRKAGPFYAIGRFSTLRSMVVTEMDISASRIRQLVASGRSIRYLVHDEVERYIREKGLYGGR
jgi:nicotinate-nucleotide adenylyltransferase